MKIAYRDWNPRGDTLEIVVAANQIIQEYSQQGYVLTLRQLYYQFVSRGIFDNTERNYKNLSNVMTKAREAGLISWLGIEDRNRGQKEFWTEENEMVPLHQLPWMIRFDRWDRQDTYIEVWVEKEALGNVISKACDPYLITHMSCKGYLSASEAWRAGQRLMNMADKGKHCVVIHLGDHDPSGIDMTRDNQERLELFSHSSGIEVRRIALNMDQVQEYQPPPNPAKITDTRADEYIRKFGRISWELDALEPAYIVELIQAEIEQFIDWDRWHEVEAQENEVRSRLEKVYSRWEDIKELIQ